jgi:cytoskeletal protein CcmA (bactofilin family)
MKIDRIIKRPIRCNLCRCQQLEPITATSTTCRACGEVVEIRGAWRTEKASQKVKLNERQDICCYQCGQHQAVPMGVDSWECVSCGTRFDLKMKVIRSVHSENVYSYGKLIIEPNGRFMGMRADSPWIQMAGFSAGTLVAANGVIIKGNSHVRGKLIGSHLEIQADAYLECMDEVQFRTVNIHGRLRSPHLTATEELNIFSTGSLVTEKIVFSSVRVEPGGVFKTKGSSLAIREKQMRAQLRA